MVTATLPFRVPTPEKLTPARSRPQCDRQPIKNCFFGGTSGSQAFGNPAAFQLTSASKATTITESAGATNTSELRITLTGVNSLAVSNTLFSGAGTGGTIIFAENGTTNNTVTDLSFDGLAFGYRYLLESAGDLRTRCPIDHRADKCCSRTFHGRVGGRSNRDDSYVPPSSQLVEVFASLKKGFPNEFGEPFVFPAAGCTDADLGRASHCRNQSMEDDA